VIRASDLIGCAVRTQSGKRLGRVHDLRAQPVNDGWQLVGVVVGRGGMVARLVGDVGPDPLVRGEVIPWQRITALEDGLIIVCDETAHTPPGFPVSGASSPP
jgi:sporulation protein YlmC with PRC-barrel domain